jgi:MarR family transcriptional regulator, organic hydroperoxide resistance regulator
VHNLIVVVKVDYARHVTQPPTPQLALDNQLCFALYSASRAITRAYGPPLAELGLTYPQYLAMLALWEADGPMAVGDVSARLRLDSGTVTPLLKRLELIGLVTRERDGKDERRVLVRLTPTGDALRQAAAAVPARIFPQLGMTPAELVRLRDELTRMVAVLDGPRDGAAG